MSDYEAMIVEDKKCSCCKRMTVSQDEYISGLEEQYAELKQKYDELNDFSNSQCKKLLEMVQKMQSCNNCKYADLLSRDYPCRECLHNRFCTSKESKWEIIE